MFKVVSLHYGVNEFLNAVSHCDWVYSQWCSQQIMGILKITERAFWRHQALTFAQMCFQSIPTSNSLHKRITASFFNASIHGKWVSVVTLQLLKKHMKLPFEKQPSLQGAGTQTYPLLLRAASPDRYQNQPCWRRYFKRIRPIMFPQLLPRLQETHWQFFSSVNRLMNGEKLSL